MEPAQNESLSPGFSEPEISGVDPQSSSKVFTMWWLVALTSLAQLTLILGVLWRCWRYDRTARENPPKPGSYNLMIDSHHQPSDVDPKPPSGGGGAAAAALRSTPLLSPAATEACCWVEEEEEERRHYPGNGFTLGQLIHWDVTY